MLATLYCIADGCSFIAEKPDDETDGWYMEPRVRFMFRWIGRFFMSLGNFVDRVQIATYPMRRRVKLWLGRTRSCEHCERA